MEPIHATSVSESEEGWQERRRHVEEQLARRRGATAARRRPFVCVRTAVDGEPAVYHYAILQAPVLPTPPQRALEMVIL